MFDESQIIPEEAVGSETKDWSMGNREEVSQYLDSQFGSVFSGRYKGRVDHGHYRFIIGSTTLGEGNAVNELLGTQKRIKNIANGTGFLNKTLELAGGVGLALRQKQVEGLVLANRALINSQYKIHLQPKRQFIPAVLQQLGQFFQEDPESVSLTAAFKVIIHPSQVETVGGGTPNIVIYPHLGQQSAKQLLRKIMARFTDDTVGTGLIPRDNFKISELIYLAQSDGDMKQALRNLHLLNRFFDPSTNFGFSYGEAQKWKDIFPVEVMACQSWQQLKSVIDTLGVIYNFNGKAYTAREWEDRIARFRRGEASIETITRNHGLRDKVLKLSGTTS